MKLETYLNFDGNCEEALEFYKKILGAEVMFMMRFKDSPEPMPAGALPAGFESKVMHSVVRIGDTTIMATDGCNSEHKGFHGFSLTLALDEVAEAERLFKALSDGGKVCMPLAPTFFAKIFGTLSDKFGVNWIVIVEAPMPANKPAKA